MTDLIMRASMFAAGAHTAVGQKRKYTGAPYIEHPRAVAQILATVTNNPYVIAAALLHDVLEDTGVTSEDLEREFGGIIASLVLEVTDVSKPTDGNRVTRKAIDRDHLAKASRDGQTIKLADLIQNTETILQHDPDFAKIYMREKRELLGVLGKGDLTLFTRAEAIVAFYENGAANVL